MAKHARMVVGKCSFNFSLNLVKGSLATNNNCLMNYIYNMIKLQMEIKFQNIKEGCCSQQNILTQ